MTKKSVRVNEVEYDAKKAGRRPQLSQKDIPATTLDDALRVPTAIAENYGHKPTSTLLVAKALDMQPSSGPFRMLCGAASSYGVTEGSAFTENISISPLGMRIVRPTTEGDDLVARREAIMRPKLVRDFLTRYNNAPIPPDHIAINVLQEMGVPAERAPGALALILQSAQQEGLITDIKGKNYITFSITPAEQSSETQSAEPEIANAALALRPIAKPEPTKAKLEKPAGADARERRVYVSHGKNRAFIGPIERLLKYGELEAVVSVEIPTVAQPVPDKVIGEMRTCGAAIIHVDAEQKLTDAEGKEQTVLNPNVLIEIGAAMALYDRRFILLVKQGVTLPSNLQGLTEVRYAGEDLNSTETINLLGAIGDIKNHPLPKLGG